MLNIMASSMITSWRGNVFLPKARTLIKSYSSQQQKPAEKPYSDTVLLPRTNFQGKITAGKRVEMDRYLLDKCGFLELYNWQRMNLEGPDFILHDGPPYANGDPHMGHTINKILKDITIRSKVINGQRVHYVPGWDCHGLPIELKALSSAKKKVSDLTPLEIRAQARKFSGEAIEKQRDVFMSWGIMADWKDSGCYFTNTPAYMINEFRQFFEMYKKNLVYRDFKPVHWSPSSRSALAESELKYNNEHKSKCVTLKLRLLELPAKLSRFSENPIYALVWTTTPWTLIANQAVAYSPSENYCLAKDCEGNLYVIAEKLVKATADKIGQLEVLETFVGEDLSVSRYAHPFDFKSLPFLPAKHVNTEEGTGLVHTAPAHGSEDFLLALKNGIPVLSLVDEEGKYTKDAGADFEGLRVLDQGNDAVLSKISKDVVHTETITHSYPYDWRTNKPVIVRASYQWFIDTNSLKDEAIASLPKIQIFPEHNQSKWQNALHTQIEARPYWCISRQRVWGTPIPVLYNKDDGKIVVTEELIERFCKLVEKNGPDFWWQLPIEKLIGKKLLASWGVSSASFQRGEDILDIWFDSGISWSSVLPDKKADLYVEGIDQFNGWFQSSLLTSIALQGVPPFKQIFVHGFVVDEKGKKMSKSVGNVTDPLDITHGGKDGKKPVLGIDVLRWWVAAHACQHTQIPMKNTLFQDSVESVQKLRTVFKFLLGVLHSYDDTRKVGIDPQYLYLDKYMLHRLYGFYQEVNNLYGQYHYNSVTKCIVNFFTNEISSIYCHLIKDRIYCDKVNSPFRLGALDVTGEILSVTARAVAPIVPHLAEEVWLHHPENLASVSLFRTKHKVPDSWNKPNAKNVVEKALEIKNCINKLTNKNTWLSSALIRVNTEDYLILSVLQEDEFSATSELCDICQVSSIRLIKDENCSTANVIIEEVKQPLCKRCRRHQELINEELCGRCTEVVNSL